MDSFYSNTDENVVFDINKKVDEDAIQLLKNLLVNNCMCIGLVNADECLIVPSPEVCNLN